MKHPERKARVPDQKDDVALVDTLDFAYGASPGPLLVQNGAGEVCRSLVLFGVIRFHWFGRGSRIDESNGIFKTARSSPAVLAKICKDSSVPNLTSLLKIRRPKVQKAGDGHSYLLLFEI